MFPVPVDKIGWFQWAVAHLYTLRVAYGFIDCVTVGGFDAFLPNGLCYLHVIAADIIGLVSVFSTSWIGNKCLPVRKRQTIVDWFNPVFRFGSNIMPWIIIIGQWIEMPMFDAFEMAFFSFVVRQFRGQVDMSTVQSGVFEDTAVYGCFFFSGLCIKTSIAKL